MGNKNEFLQLEHGLKTMSKDELIQELNNAKLETFKYVNKFLEVEEKWAFINLLLKKLNSIKQKQELCKTICEGFLKLTNSKVCACSLFNQDTAEVEFRKIAVEEGFNNHKRLNEFVEKIDNDCSKLLSEEIEIKKVIEYFENNSRKKLIIVPILYSKSLLGYLMLINEDDDFHKENIHFVSIFPEHIALILENISLYQESEKRNKQKIEFLAGISHEFKTPLNSIIGFAEILDSNDEKSKNRKYVGNILKSSKHLLSLIDDVLDVSKSQYNNLELKYTNFNPREEIIQIILTFEKMINEKKIDLNYTFAAVNICADLKRFRQLIYNLISNAIKFNKQNGKIDIFTYVQNENFFFEITDSGDGINKKNHEKIFDFFSQVNRSQLKRQSGSGVGLALCKMIVDAHNGKINFKSQARKGSSFWFSLPLEPINKLK